MGKIECDRMRDFYEQYPDKFVEDCLGLKLSLHQKIVLRLYTIWYKIKNCTKALSAIDSIRIEHIVCRCVLMPNCKVLIAVPTRQNARNIASYISRHYHKYCLSKAMTLTMERLLDDIVLTFENGSVIKITSPSLTPIRGKRAKFIRYI